MSLIPVEAKLGLSIRGATKNDWRAIRELQAVTNRPKRADSAITDYFVAEVRGEITGCAGLRIRTPCGYLYGLVVHPRWRKQGIGHCLTSQRIERTIESNLERAYVLSMFWNVRFFKRHGFELLARSEAAQLGWLHKDFTETWCNRSALLCISPCRKICSPQSR